MLNRPEAMNTMHPLFWRELDAALTHIHKTGEARVLVISSTGKHFSAGMALETFGSGIAMDDQSPEGRAAIFDLLTDMQTTFTKLETLRIPVIAAIQGGCIGGAVDMVTACCLRYATADAFSASRKSTSAWWPTWARCSACPSCCRWPSSRNWPIPDAACRRPGHWATAWSTRCLIQRRPCWPPRCSARTKSPPSRRWRSGAASRPSTTRATISVDDALRQMGWLQGAIWSNAHVRESVTAMKEKRAGQFPGLAPLKNFSEFGQ